MPGALTELTEIGTALGMIAPTPAAALIARPPALVNVDDRAWSRLVSLHASGAHAAAFDAAFANGAAFRVATDGLRDRPPLLVEWKGPHRPPGDDAIPADLRIDHVFLISCKYLNKNNLSPGPARLFERLLIGDARSGQNWFAETAAMEYQALYDAAREQCNIPGLPTDPATLTEPYRSALRHALGERRWPPALQDPWRRLCEVVAVESARRWTAAMSSKTQQLRLLWRMLRITTAAYFVLGTAKAGDLRLRIDSAWDWTQAFELRRLKVEARPAGQPEVGWAAIVRRRRDLQELLVEGHVEVRWSHGRFKGAPEAKIYVDTPFLDVPGYNALT